jgi:hypothetical protein
MNRSILAVALSLLSLAACAAPTAEPTSVPSPSAPSAVVAPPPSDPPSDVPRAMSEAQAIERARACADAAPFRGRGVSGSPLRYGAAKASRREAVWLVSFQEERPNTLPNGLDMVVNAYDGRCSGAPMD